MLPRPTDNGARLAAILPSAVACLATGNGFTPDDVLRRWRSCEEDPRVGCITHEKFEVNHELFTSISSLIVIVVDGLGFSNLKASASYARSVSMMPTKRIDTVVPSTTGAALTSLTTGSLPGAHGLIGYQIRHPRAGLISTLKGWSDVEDHADWQRQNTLFHVAETFGVRSIAIGRAAHATGGLTESILSGAEYLSGATIEDRFAIASQAVRGQESVLAYLYVDELDRAAHAEGWQSNSWLRRLEQLDAAVDSLLRTLPGGVGVVLTADHGMIDVTPERQLVLDEDPELRELLTGIGGEPRMRSLYCAEGVDPNHVVDHISASFGKRVWVGNRAEAIDANWFGPIESDIADRLGEVLVLPRAQYSCVLTSDSADALAMVGQHGGLSDDERGVPLALGGTLAGTSFVAAVNQLAKYV